MANSLAHRGPDGEGYFTERNVALGHRRLAIIDLDSGQQPMYSEDDNLVIVFNGEIYNYIELREELRSKGYRFRTKSDTEVILKAYEEWGVDSVYKFNGMWAFALWDRKRERLFCSRDRLGEKPFFYAVHDGSFVFGSEIKALFEYGVPKNINAELLDIYLCLTYIPAPFTFFKGISKLSPGHSIIIDKQHVAISRYWDIKFLPEREARRDEHRIFEEFSHIFYDSVFIRMRSDVPYGAFLSGGLDSGSVVSAMNRAAAEPVKTFTIGFQENEFDERKLASLVASQFSTHHRERVVSIGDLVELMEKLAWHYDEPFGDASAIPTYLISQVARREVKVALTGDGGDEILSGYTIVQSEKLSNQLKSVPKILTNPIIGLLALLESISPTFLQKRLLRPVRVLEAANLEFVDRLESKQLGFSRWERKALLANHGKSVIPVKSFIEEITGSTGNANNLNRLNHWLLMIALPDDMLCKVDRASMANSLETRIPFLDYRLVELMASVSMHVKLRGYERKKVLRETIGRTLPGDILKGRKRGFAVPLQHWLSCGRVPVVMDRAMEAADKGFVKKKAFIEILSELRICRYDMSSAIYALAMLGYA